MGKTAAVLNSKEKIIGVDLEKFPESGAGTDLKIRWVNGDARKRRQPGTTALEDAGQPLPEVMLDEESESSEASSI